LLQLDRGTEREFLVNVSRWSVQQQQQQQQQQQRVKNDENDDGVVVKAAVLSPAVVHPMPLTSDASAALR